MNEAKWRNEMLEIVQAASHAEMTTRPKTVHEFEQDFIEVTYDTQPNTIRTLSQASNDLKTHTRIIVRSDRDTIQFKHSKRELAEELKGTALIRKILEEDIPVRRKFKPEYTVYENCVIVESPEITPIRLFNSLTRMWKLTGVYESDGVYHQRFEQELPYEESQETDSFLEKYGKLRLQNLVFSFSLPCQACGGEVKYTPLSPQDASWKWKCNACDEEYGESRSLEALLGPIDPLWSRQRIREYIYDNGVSVVSSPT